MKNVLIFLAGVSVGAGAAWYFTKRKYQKEADEEIADVVEKFKEYRKVLEDKEKELNLKPSNNKGRKVVPSFEEGLSESSEELSNGTIDEVNIETHENESTFPYVISEDEYGENDDYDTKMLFWYYKDNILATDEDLEVENIQNTVGDALEEFKKDRYTERVLVRNEQDETDYEILISEKHFYEVTGGDKD